MPCSLLRRRHPPRLGPQHLLLRRRKICPELDISFFGLAACRRHRSARLVTLSLELPGIRFELCETRFSLGPLSFPGGDAGGRFLELLRVLSFRRRRRLLRRDDQGAELLRLTGGDRETLQRRVALGHDLI